MLYVLYCVDIALHTVQCSTLVIGENVSVFYFQGKLAIRTAYLCCFILMVCRLSSWTEVFYLNKTILE